jgi:hypothetical protein
MIYACIKHYQKLKWSHNYEAVHVYIVLPHRGVLSLFEQTWPRAQWTPVEYLKDKTYCVCECLDHASLDIGRMAMDAELRVWNTYDLGDLLDFAVSGFLFKMFRRVIRIFGDKARRVLVCSTMAASLLRSGGCESITNPMSVDPAYFENDLNWCTVARYVQGRPT